jgi:hypothetical protein
MSRLSLLYKSFAVSIFCVLALGLIASPSVAAAGISLTTSPVSEVLTSKPGTNATTILHVENNDPAPVPVTIKMFTFGAAGTSGKPALVPATAADTFISWAHFSPSTFVAQPNVPVAVTMTIDIPKTASLGYNYGVGFEPVTAKSLSGSGTIYSGSNVILVLLDTSSANEVHSVQVSSFTASKKLYEYLPATFSINVHNNGNIFLAPAGDIFISKDSGFSSGSIIDTIPINSGQGNVLPNSNRIFQTEWSDGFPVNVLKEIDGHDVEKNDKLVYNLKWDWSNANKFRFGEYYAKLIMTYDNGERQVPVTAVLSFWVIPWKLLLLLALILLVFIGLIIGVIYLIHRLRKLNKAVYRRHV